MGYSGLRLYVLSVPRIFMSSLIAKATTFVKQKPQGFYYINDRILAPCNYCHHPLSVGCKSYHKALLIMFGCGGISDHASRNEVFHYWDIKLSCIHNLACVAVHRG